MAPHESAGLDAEVCSVAHSPSLWTRFITVAAITAGLRATANDDAGPQQHVVLQFVDDAAIPVTGANIGTSVRYESDRPTAWYTGRRGTTRQPLCTTDERGELLIRFDPKETRTKWWFYAVQPDRALAAVFEVDRRVSGAVPVRLQPAGRVCGSIVSTELSALRRPLDADLAHPHGETTTRLVRLTEGGPVELAVSVSMERAFSFLVPPGSYEIAVTGTDLATRILPITVDAGRREYDLGEIDVPAGVAAQRGDFTRPRPREMITLLAETIGARKLCLSADAKWLATGHWLDRDQPSNAGRLPATAELSGEVRIWSALSGDLEQVFEIADSPVTAICWSHDAQFLAAACRDGTVRIWEREPGRLCARFQGQNRTVDALVFLGESGAVAVSGAGATISIHDILHDGALVDELRGHEARVRALAHISAGNQLVSIGWDRTLRFWDVDGARLKRTIRLDAMLPNGLAVFDNGATIAAGGILDSNGQLNGGIVLVDRESATTVETLQFPISGGHVSDVAGLAGKSQFVVAAARMPVLFVGIDAAGDSRLAVARGFNAGRTRAVAVSGDGRVLATVDSSGVVKLWDLSAW